MFGFSALVVVLVERIQVCIVYRFMITKRFHKKDESFSMLGCLYHSSHHQQPNPTLKILLTI